MIQTFQCAECDRTVNVYIELGTSHDEVSQKLADADWFYGKDKTVLCPDEAPDPEDPNWQ